MNREFDLNEIRQRFNLEIEVKDNKLCFSSFNGYIKNDDTYSDLEELCEDICYYIEDKYECYTDYSILEEGYEFVIEVF